MLLSKCTVWQKKSRFIKQQEAKGLLSYYVIILLLLVLFASLNKIPLLGDILFFNLDFVYNESIS